MPDLILDTDIVSFLYRGDPRATALLSRLGHKVPAISFVSLGELLRWPIVRNWGVVKQQHLLGFVRKFEIVWANEVICAIWAEITALKGRPVNFQDAWIAATALSLALPLVTHNRRHYQGIPGLVLDGGEVSKEGA